MEKVNTEVQSLSWAEIIALTVKIGILLPSGVLQIAKTGANYGMQFKVLRYLNDDTIKEVWLWDGKSGKYIIVTLRDTISFESKKIPTLTKAESTNLMEEARIYADSIGDPEAMYMKYGILVEEAIEAKATAS